jgi:hypothetical protein
MALHASAKVIDIKVSIAIPQNTNPLLEHRYDVLITRPRCYTAP